MTYEALATSALVIFTAWVSAKVIAREWFRAKMKHFKATMALCETGEANDVT